MLWHVLWLPVAAAAVDYHLAAGDSASLSAGDYEYESNAFLYSHGSTPLAGTDYAAMR